MAPGQRGVPGGDAEVGRALEHRQLRGLGGDDGDRLDRGGARADHPHALAGEVDALVGPEARVMHLAREALETRDVGHAGNREAAGRHDQERGGEPLAAVRGHRPAVARLVEDRLGHARAEPDVAAEVEALGDVLEVAQDLGLAGVALATTSTPARARATTNTSTSCSRCRSARRGSGSRTRSRRCRSPDRPRAPTFLPRASGAGGTARRCRHPR